MNEKTFFILKKFRNGTTKMKKTAEDYLGDSVESAVITVPAYFKILSVTLQKMLVKLQD